MLRKRTKKENDALEYVNRLRTILGARGILLQYTRQLGVEKYYKKDLDEFVKDLLTVNDDWAMKRGIKIRNRRSETL